MFILKALRVVARGGIALTYVLLAGCVVFFPILYSLEEGLFTMMRLDPLVEHMRIKDSLIPMFLVAMLCVLFRAIEQGLAFAIERVGRKR